MLGFQGGVSIPLVKGGVKAPPAKRQCRAAPKAWLDAALPDTMFAGHHQPLKVWVLCLYFMGLNISHEQMAQAWALHGSEVHEMTTQLRAGSQKKADRDAVRRSGVRRSLCDG